MCVLEWRSWSAPRAFYARFRTRSDFVLTARFLLEFFTRRCEGLEPDFPEKDRDVPEDFFTSKHRGKNTTMRYLHYPGRATEGSGGAGLGAGAHTDYGSITLLFQDGVGGLQLQQEDWL